MKKTLITGVLYQPFRSWPAASQSDDGVIWDTPSSPFEVGDSPTGIATNGTIVAVSNGRGYVATSYDMLNYSVNEVSDGFGIQDISHKNGRWLAVGQRIYTSSYGPYGAMSEVSQIHLTTAADGAWSMAWSNPEVNSQLYQVRWFQSAPISDSVSSNVWVTVGAVGSSANAWYSLDSGNSWAQVIIPAGIGRIFSVGLVTIGAIDYWYWGSSGKIFKSATLNSPEWTQVSIDGTGPITDINYQNGSLVIAGTDRIYSSQDGLYLNSWSYPGYVFDRIGYIENDGSGQWMAFARSNLTQYTQWTSTDLISWTPSNNGLHVSGFTSNA